jgi:hypothetical protein
MPTISRFAYKTGFYFQSSFGHFFPVFQEIFRQKVPRFPLKKVPGTASLSQWG